RATITGVIAAAMLAVTPLTVAPASAASPGVYNGGSVVLVGSRDQWWKKRHRHRHYRQRHHRHHHRHYHRHRDRNIGIGIFGFAAGAMLGSALSQPNYYAGGNRHDYCASKYRTYKPW